MSREKREKGSDKGGGVHVGTGVSRAGRDLARRGNPCPYVHFPPFPLEHHFLSGRECPLDPTCVCLFPQTPSPRCSIEYVGVNGTKHCPYIPVLIAIIRTPS